MLAPSAFLASAAATLPHQEAILSASVAGADDTAVSNIKTTRSCLANTTEPSDLSKHIKRAWDAPVTNRCNDGSGTGMWDSEPQIASTLSLSMYGSRLIIIILYIYFLFFIIFFASPLSTKPEA